MTLLDTVHGIFLTDSRRSRAHRVRSARIGEKDAVYRRSSCSVVLAALLSVMLVSGGAFALAIPAASRVALEPARASVDSPYEADLRFAVDEIEKQCKQLLVAKKIDWRKVTAPLVAQAAQVKSDAEHCKLLVRLLARLQDGHAEVRPTAKTKDLTIDWPDRSAAPGLFLCRIGKGIHVKNSWGAAEAVGLKPGMELVSVDGVPALAWLEARSRAIADSTSFSTPQQAFFHVCHWGLADAADTRWEIEFKDKKGAKKKRTLTLARGKQVPNGPAFLPEGLAGSDDLRYAKTSSGCGYVHVRRCKESLPAELDSALEALGDVPGLVLDFRGNSGGGFDHEAFMGRFVPPGKELSFSGSRYASAGAHPYLGPVVVIVDATVRSAGETAAGIFKEDGRGYMIGESATAGMSSQKTTIGLPSGSFELYVSVHSNKQRFQGGKGIEGLGVQPHELVPFDVDDLAAQRDTLIRRAEALLAKFPQSAVPYDPADFGWKARAK